MNDLICEEIARKAGFAVSVGNWISPDGSLILGENYDTHHKDTLLKYLGDSVNQDICRNCENILQCMNHAISAGYIRLVFRADVCIQVGAEKMEELWSDSPNYKRMMSILSKLEDVEIHMFSKDFYVIGVSQNIINQEWDKLQIREK